MPGLVGVIGCDGDAGGLLSKMAGAMRTKEWYKVDDFVDDETAAIGRVHLGIFCPQKQPAFSQDGSLAAFMDGELYAESRLRREIEGAGQKAPSNGHLTLALKAYECWGEDFANHLEGSFVVAIWDRRQRKLVIANDRFGLRPVYYALLGGKLLFGSECKAILADPAFKREANDTAIAEILSFGYILGDKTMVKDIYALSPSSVLVFQNGALSARTYWFPTGYLSYGNGRFDGNESDFLEEARILFNRAVKKRLAGGYRLGLPLSGGMDSRAILSAIDADVEIACVNFYGLEHATDVKLSRQVAKAIGRKLNSYNFGPDILKDYAGESVRVTEGMLSATQCHGIAPVSFMKQHADVLISGWGGEFPRGAMFEDRTAKGSPKLPFEWNDHAGMETHVFNFDARVFTPEQQQSLLAPEYYARTKGLAHDSFRKVVEATRNFPCAWDRLQHFFLWERSHRWNIFGLTFINTQLEWRAPFADYDFIDAFSRIPLSLQRKTPFSLIHRYIISQNNPELGRIPEAVTGLPLDSSLMRVRLSGLYNQLIAARGIRRLRLPAYHYSYYVDYDESIRNRLGDFVRDIVLDKRTLDRGYFNPNYLQDLVEGQMAGRRWGANQLGVILTLELWHREFMD